MPSDKKKGGAAAAGGDSSGSEEEVGEVFEVDRILKKRQVNKKTEYLIRWKGFGPEEDSWEPPANLEGCPEIVEAFEKKFSEKMKQQKSELVSPVGSGSQSAVGQQQQQGKRKGGTPAAAGSGEAKKAKESTGSQVLKTGFDRNYEPEKIIGATDSTGELMFLIKWKNLEEAELVPARVANKKCPQVVISFYEERLTWTGPAE